jgi:hypothetical protein
MGITRNRSQQILGWLAVALSTLLCCFWAFWGGIENFHEGWHYPSLLMNLGLMLVQYLSPMLLVLAAALMGLRWPWLGGGLHITAALAVAWFFRSSASVIVYAFIAGPLMLLGALYWFGRPQPRRWAAAIVAGVPLLTLVVSAAVPAMRVASRWDDGDRGARRVAGNGVDLVWAPAGPGWPSQGVSWDEAVRRCRYLNADGMSLADTAQDIWRLPTVEEVVRSQCYHGRNCHGIWDAATAHVRYDTTPDKEPPLWDPHSKVIYWWTATELDDQRAYISVYNGRISPRPKHVRWGYLGFRAVRESQDARPSGPGTPSRQGNQTDTLRNGQPRSNASLKSHDLVPCLNARRGIDQIRRSNPP